MAWQQAVVRQIIAEHSRYFFCAKIIQVIPLVTGIRAPVDRHLVGHGVEVDERDLQLICERLRAVVARHVPVDCAGRADEHQLRAVFVTEGLDALNIGAVSLRDGSVGIRWRHIIAGVRRSGVAAQLIPFGIFGVGVIDGHAPVICLQRFPPVVVGKHREEVAGLLQQHTAVRKIDEDHIGLQDHKLGRLLLEGFVQERFRIVQCLSGCAAAVGRVTVLLPQLHRDEGGIALAVTEDEQVDRVVRFSENAVGRGVMDAVAAGVVFWPHQLRHTGQQKCQHGEKNDASERMFEKTGHACLLKIRIHGVDGNVALSVCSENDDEQNERVEDRPAYRSRALCQQRAHGLAFFVDHAHDEHDQQCHSNDHEVKLVNTERLEERIVKDGECKSGDHGAEHLHTCTQAVCTEKQLADDDQHRRAQHLQQTVREALGADVQPRVDGPHRRGDDVAAEDQHEVVHAEKEIAPRGTVPETVAEPHAKERDGARQQWTVVVAEAFAGGGSELFQWLERDDRVEYIVLEPGAERDVPALPEFRDRLGEKRLSEVFRHCDAEDLRRAGDGVHRARKVHVQLHGVAHGSQCDHAAVKVGVVIKDISHERVEPVGDDDLFHHAVGNALQTERQVLVGDWLCVPELLRGLVVAADRPFHDLREEADEQRQAQQIRVRFCDAALHVHDVGQRLQREKGDTDRHHILRDRQLHGNVQVRQERVDIRRGEAGIFECEQDADVQNDGQQKDPVLHGLLPLAHGLALGFFRLREQKLRLRLYFVQPQSEVVHRKRRQKQVYEQLAADQPEKGAVGGEQEVFFPAPRHETVHHETKRQEHDEKCRREEGGQGAPFSREEQRRKLHFSIPPAGACACLLFVLRSA